MKYCNSIFGTFRPGAAFAMFAMFVLASCGKVDDAVDVAKVELGAVQKEYIVDAGTGKVEVEVYSNLKYRINHLNQASWATLSDNSLFGDSKFTIAYEFNEEFPRMAAFTITNDIDSRTDTIYLKQRGLIVPTLSMANTSMILNGGGGVQFSDIDCNIPIEDLIMDISYPEEGDQDWITEVDIESGKLTVDSESNIDQLQPRTAVIAMSYVDGWGQEVSLKVNVTQRNAQETLGRDITFAELRSTYGDETGYVIPDFVLIKGIVVSDKNSGNAGENLQTTTSAIDYNGSKTSIYLQNADGSLGFLIQTETPEDNIFSRYSEVQFLLKGATVKALEDPERYIISGVTSAMVTSNIAGTAARVPTKERYMNELTDADMYTWVTLKDCEIPVRKGALVPANEGYTIATNAHRLSKYPMLIRDVRGSDMYMYTNTVCLYRNDGTCLPYGSGKLSGVIVHEKFTRFEYEDVEDAEDDDEYGNIGRYQIRHMSKEDIWGQMNTSVEDSFSALLTEYRFQNSNYDGTAAPTYGTNGWLTHTYQEKYTHDPGKNYVHATYQTHFWSAGEYCYLGPIGNNVNYMFGLNTGNKNGCGIVLDLTKEHYDQTPSVADRLSDDGNGKVEWAGPHATNATVKAINDTGGTNSGKGDVGGGCLTTFASNFWWDEPTSRPYGWMINFSTKDIVTDQLSMQISVCNFDQNFYKPRFWKAEWSTVDSMDEADDDKWNLIGEYTVPDLGIWSLTLISATNAYKYINFQLPLEMLGKENVYVRLVPRDARASSGEGYKDSWIFNGTTGAQASALAYFAIRYNK